MPYRDEVEALRTREAQLAGELEEVRRMRVASEKRALPVLENLRVASPCPAKWEDMIGDERVRFCGSCAKNVYDLSAMTRSEAEGFVASRSERSEDVCVTFRRRADGRVLTSDCPVGLRRRRRFGLGVVAFAAIAGAAVYAGVIDPEPCGTRGKLERQAPAPKHAGAHAKSDLGALDPDQDPGGGKLKVDAFDDRGSITGLIAPPRKAHSSSSRTTGCLCQAGDPLCSCL